MRQLRRWDRCVSHRGGEAEQFVDEYFASPDRQTLLIAGAGFDPRSVSVAERLAGVMGTRLRCLLLREHRPNPDRELVIRAERNLERQRKAIPNSTVAGVDVFASDNAAVGGRDAVRRLSEFDRAEATDVVVDLSALSLGISFPLVRYLFEIAQVATPPLNLHLMVVDEPTTDAGIHSFSSDVVDPIHGFRGGLGLEENVDAARLWLPQLRRGSRTVLDRIHSVLVPHDVCPIVPFPASNPRLADELIEEYREEFESAWGADTRNIIYAGEHNPLDLYRTILRIDDARRRVFEGVGGSLLVLSPIGSKTLAIGALLAAIERDFPVMHVETIAYEVNFATLDFVRQKAGDIVHIWLTGDAYHPSCYETTPT